MPGLSSDKFPIAVLTVVHVIVRRKVGTMTRQSDSQPGSPELAIVGHAPHDGQDPIHVADAPTDDAVRACQRRALQHDPVVVSSGLDLSRGRSQSVSDLVDLPGDKLKLGLSERDRFLINAFDHGGVGLRLLECLES